MTNFLLRALTCQLVLSDRDWVQQLGVFACLEWLQLQFDLFSRIKVWWSSFENCVLNVIPLFSHFVPHLSQSRVTVTHAWQRLVQVTCGCGTCWELQSSLAVRHKRVESKGMNDLDWDRDHQMCLLSSASEKALLAGVYHFRHDVQWLPVVFWVEYMRKTDWDM